MTKKTINKTLDSVIFFITFFGSMLAVSIFTALNFGGLSEYPAVLTLAVLASFGLFFLLAMLYFGIIRLLNLQTPSQAKREATDAPPRK